MCINFIKVNVSLVLAGRSTLYIYVIIIYMYLYMYMYFTRYPGLFGIWSISRTRPETVE